MSKEIKFTEEEISSIMYEGGVYDEAGEKLMFETVSEEVTGTDQEKGRVEYEYVIKEISTGKFYSATLAQSPWWKQGQVNATEEWSEVKPEIVKKTVYK
jgi:hypothetical protein